MTLKIQRFFMVALIAAVAPVAQAGSYIFAGANPDIVLHSSNYTGTGGTINVSICIGPTVSTEVDPPQPADLVIAVQNVVDRYNLLTPTIGNLRTGSDNELSSGQLDWESALTHEIGHCVGLAHVNLASESGLSGADRNYTKTTTGTDGTFNLGIGGDGVRGSPDDLRGDDVNLHWFLNNGNDPFAIADGSVDSSNFTRTLADLPAGDTFVANGDRTVSTSVYSLPATESVMQQGQGSNEDQRSLTGGDVATLLYARSGLDATAGTGDDYTVNYVYGGIATGCDINVAFNDDETGFAVCQVSSSGLGGNNRRITAANTFYNAGSNWVFPTRRIPLPSSETLATTTGGTVAATVGAATSLIANDADQDGAGLLMSTTSFGGPEHGSVTLVSDGSFSYTHDGTGTTEDFFVYRVCVDDGSGGETNTCSHQRVDIDIAVTGNTAPMPQDDAATVVRGGTVTLLDSGLGSLLANDTDPEDDNLTLQSPQVSNPSNGTVTLNTATGGFSYAHDGSLTSSDQFVYQVCDDGSPALCAEATVNIVVDLGDVICSEPSSNIPDGDAVTGLTDTISNASIDDGVTDLDVILEIDHSWVGDLTATLSHAGTSVTLLDRPGRADTGFGCDGDNILATLDDEAAAAAEDECAASTPTISGTFSPSEPLAGFEGQNYLGDWDLQITDSVNQDAGVLARWCLVPTLGAVPNNPPAADNDGGTTDEAVAITIDVLDNDSDSDGSLVPGSVTVTSGPSNGGTSVNPTNGAITYTPDTGFSGSDSFTYTVDDDDGATSNTATVSITVNAIPNNPPTADNDGGTTDEAVAITIDVLDNDSDSDGSLEPSSVTVTSGPNNGGTSVDPANGAITYTPNAGFSGGDSFTYTVDDNDGATSNAATVSITVNAIPNNPPTADNDGGTTDEAVAITIDVLDNDGDSDGSLAPGSVTVTSGPSNGGTSVNPTNGAITYTPDAGFSGSDSFTYTVDDDEGATSNAATVTIQVNPVQPQEELLFRDGFESQ